MITDEQIELLAREMCRQLGLDPEEKLSAGSDDTLTPSERAKSGGYISDVVFIVERWRIYRNTAATVLAGHNAMLTLGLTAK